MFAEVNLKEENKLKLSRFLALKSAFEAFFEDGAIIKKQNNESYEEPKGFVKEFFSRMLNKINKPKEVKEVEDDDLSNKPNKIDVYDDIKLEILSKLSFLGAIRLYSAALNQRYFTMRTIALTHKCLEENMDEITQKYFNNQRKPEEVICFVLPQNYECSSLNLFSRCFIIEAEKWNLKSILIERGKIGLSIIKCKKKQIWEIKHESFLGSDYSKMIKCTYDENVLSNVVKYAIERGFSPVAYLYFHENNKNSKKITDDDTNLIEKDKASEDTINHLNLLKKRNKSKKDFKFIGNSQKLSNERTYESVIEQLREKRVDLTEIIPEIFEREYQSEYFSNRKHQQGPVRKLSSGRNPKNSEPQPAFLHPILNSNPQNTFPSDSQIRPQLRSSQNPRPISPLFNQEYSKSIHQVPKSLSPNQQSLLSYNKPAEVFNSPNQFTPPPSIEGNSIENPLYDTNDPPQFPEIKKDDQNPHLFNLDEFLNEKPILNLISDPNNYVQAPPSLQNTPENIYNPPSFYPPSNTNENLISNYSNPPDLVPQSHGFAPEYHNQELPPNHTVAPSLGPVPKIPSLSIFNAPNLSNSAPPLLNQDFSSAYPKVEPPPLFGHHAAPNISPPPLLNHHIAPNFNQALPSITPKTDESDNQASILSSEPNSISRSLNQPPDLFSQPPPLFNPFSNQPEFVSPEIHNQAEYQPTDLYPQPPSLLNPFSNQPEFVSPEIHNQSENFYPPINPSYGDLDHVPSGLNLGNVVDVNYSFSIPNKEENFERTGNVEGNNTGDWGQRYEGHSDSEFKENNNAYPDQESDVQTFQTYKDDSKTVADFYNINKQQNLWTCDYCSYSFSIESHICSNCWKQIICVYCLTKANYGELQCSCCSMDLSYQ